MSLFDVNTKLKTGYHTDIPSVFIENSSFKYTIGVDCLCTLLPDEIKWWAGLEFDMCALTGPSTVSPGKLRHIYSSSYLPELHDQVHERGGGAVGLLSRAHGGLQQILNGDLVPQSLVEQPLTGRELTVGQDLDLQREKSNCD